VDAAVRRSDGLVPFYRLGQNERYAEVVGHELAHAVQMLENPEYAHLCLKLDVQAAEYLLSRRQSASGAVADEVTRLRQARLQSLTDKIEKPAQAAELEVWRELLNGQRKGARTAAGHRAETTAAP